MCFRGMHFTKVNRMFGGLSNWLFDTSGLTPHGFCLLWEPGLLWLHAISDVGIGLSYFVIPFVLVAALRRRRDLGFRPIFYLFAAFILLCGAGHWLNLLTLWVPAYGVEGIVKAMTATVSIMTAFALWRLIPTAIAWPSSVQLREVTSQLASAQQVKIRMACLVEEAGNARNELTQELLRREAAERIAVESEERLRLILQSSVAEAVYLLDPNGNIETWNAGAERLKGYAPAEIIGQNFATFFTAEDIRTGEPARMLATARDSGQFTIEGLRVRKDGTQFLARVSIDAVLNRNGSLRGFVKVTTDISGPRIEEEQRVIMIEAAPNGMMIVDETGIIRLVNTQVEAIFGYPHGSLVGLSVETLVPDNIRVAHRGMRSKFTSGQDVRAMATGPEFIGRKWDGSDVPIEILLNPVKTPRGRIVIASLFDITERRRVAKEKHDAEMRERLAIEAINAKIVQQVAALERSNKDLDDFAYIASHDLKEPLRGLLNNARFLHEDYADKLDAEGVGRLSRLGYLCQRMEQLINDLLYFSRLGRQELAIQLTDINEVIRDIETMSETVLNERSATITIPNKLPVISCDKVRVTEVFRNLIMNAVKYNTNDTKHVEIGYCQGMQVDESNEQNIFYVKDNGIGIAREFYEDIFRIFKRLNPEDDDKKGTGAGLTFVRKIVQRHGGRVWLTSALNEGTTFYFTIGQGPVNEAGI
jgi:PAS domain S-box-containing protein